MSVNALIYCFCSPSQCFSVTTKVCPDLRHCSIYEITKLSFELAKIDTDLSNFKMRWNFVSIITLLPFHYFLLSSIKVICNQIHDFQIFIYSKLHLDYIILYEIDSNLKTQTIMYAYTMNSVKTWLYSMFWGFFFRKKSYSFFFIIKLYPRIP